MIRTSLLQRLSQSCSIFRDNVVVVNAVNVVFSRDYIRVPANIRDKIDFSRVPEVDPKDVDERTHRGSGPGGQAAAKTNYAVTLIHRPTSVTVRCEEHRYNSLHHSHINFVGNSLACIIIVVRATNVILQTL